MKEKIKIPIKDIIMTKDSIIGFAKCISTQKNAGRICFNIKFINEQEIESNDIIIFENEKFNEYEIKTIHMTYVDKDYTKDINVWINNYGLYSGDSYIEISYDNKENMDWLAVTEKNFIDQISYCEKRNKIITIMQKDSVLFFVICFLNFFSSVFLSRLILNIFSINTEKFMYIIILIFIAFLAFSIYWKELFSKAFPKVEINIQEKNNSAKKARNKIYFVLTVFIIPFILDIIYSIIKKYIGIS